MVHTAAGSLGNFFEQAAAARPIVTGKLGAIGDVVEKQIQSSVFSRGLQSSVFSLQSLSMLTTEDCYGFVLAISGTTSPVRFGCGGARWYLTSPSRRNSKPSSGESTMRNRSRSAGEIVPASIMASKLISRFQYSLP